MDLKDELKETIEESKRAKIIKDSLVKKARSDADSHANCIVLWILVIVFCALSILGLYVENLYIVSSCIIKVLSIIGVEDYSLYVCIALIVLGIRRIVLHKIKKTVCLEYAEQIESMSLKEFRHTYM